MPDESAATRAQVSRDAESREGIVDYGAMRAASLGRGTAEGSSGLAPYVHLPGGKIGRYRLLNPHVVHSTHSQRIQQILARVILGPSCLLVCS